MNIHPLFVHFPIGIFAAYTAFELLPLLFTSLRTAAWVRPAKIWLVSLGVLSLCITFPTGDMAAELLDKKSAAARIVETHEFFAGLTFLTYALIAFFYVTREVTDGRFTLPPLLTRLTPFIRKCNPLARIAVDTPLRYLLLLLGILFMFVTGSLGAAMVYGPQVEPLVTFVYTLLIH